ncbi:MAG: alpha/beta hydrolase [Oscillospiraceae bacterium]|nr:alpha/beta hydrolase [Oscillospiraceae bacterium]
MPQYPYRLELKQPRTLGGIDFGNPALTPMVRMVVQNLRRATRAWTPPESISFRAVSVFSKDGESVECFVVEPEDDSPLPGMLYCHGGGFYLPLETPALELAAVYAQKLRVRVFLPEYRLLPEHPYPIPLQDCRTVWTAMGERGTEFHLDGRALLYGESAGGALAAGLAQQLRDEGKPIPCGQVLIYPALDDRSEKYPSVERYSGAVWTKRANSQMWSGYLKNGFQGPEGHAVPLRAGDFSRLSPAYVEPQGIDLLRDEGAAYGERLREAGVPVKVNIIEGSYHGFDADVENPFVQTVLEQRIRAMADMLADHKNEE